MPDNKCFFCMGMERSTSPSAQTCLMWGSSCIRLSWPQPQSSGRAGQCQCGFPMCPVWDRIHMPRLAAAGRAMRCKATWRCCASTGRGLAGVFQSCFCSLPPVSSHPEVNEGQPPGRAPWITVPWELAPTSLLRPGLALPQLGTRAALWKCLQ